MENAGKGSSVAKEKSWRAHRKGNDMKILLLQQPKSFSDYPEWIKEVQERFGRLEVMVFTSDNRAVHHRWPNAVIKEIVVSDYSSDSATAKFFDIVRKFKPR